MKLVDKLTSIVEYISLMGFNWFVFRIKYELLKKFNYFNKVNKDILKKVNIQDKNLFLYKKIGLIKDNLITDYSFIQKANKAIKGKVFSFSNEYFDYMKYGKINWQMNPISKIEANNKLSWNNLPDFAEYGDIKLIWEASRFSQVYYFINAYAGTQDTKYAKECIKQIINWIDDNPYPKGVNYKCGQEISFRLFAWVNAMEYFNDFIYKEDEKKIVESIYISWLRINANIDYAIKSVKNNHSISEASGLFIIGLLFPQFKESKKLVQKGLKYLLKETAYQVYDDGSYIQHSFTYQRLAVDTLSFVFLVANKKQFDLPKILKERQYKMVVFLNSFMQSNGWLPNYGSNDGANLFPIDDSNYRDFRTSLNFALRKSEFFDIQQKEKKILDNEIEFNDGGYYILKNKNIFSFIKSHSYKHRPASNDMFHVDVWYKGQNIFCDSGSYSYNTDKIFKDNFIGVVGHNTIMINDTNQMAQVLNFGYSNWTKTKKLSFGKNYFLGENYAYKKEFDVVQKRSVDLEENKLIIIDNITKISTQTNIKQIWNTKCKVEVIDKYSLKVDNCIITSNIPYKIEVSYISDYYNFYVEGSRIIFEIASKDNFKIETTMEFK
jgi:hypothetical protein